MNSYHAELKTTVSLKDMVERHADRTQYKVDLILHDVPNVTPAQLAAYVERDTGIPVSDQEILQRKIRLTVPQDKLAALAALDSVNRIEEVRSYGAYNDQARTVLLGSDIVEPRSVASVRQGTGQMICVADTGFDQGVVADTADIKVHPALVGRVEHLMGMTPNTIPKDPTGHGTHVCASICGDGVYKNVTDSTDVPVRGTAPSAKLMVQAMSLFSDDRWHLVPPAEITKLFSSAYAMGVRVHSNSWGKNISTTYGQLGYEADATEIDRFAADNLDFCILVAAGNDAKNKKSKKSQIGAGGAAKNCITVGAVGTTRDNDGERYTRGFKHGSNISTTAVFSSRGPTLSTLDANGQSVDGRIKPDVVAPGVAILSAASRAMPMDSRDRVVYGPSDDPDWMFTSGTSMSTPLVAGCVALLREELQAVGKQRPSAALIKALLINGATRDGIGKPVFDYEQGFGRVNVHASIAMIQAASFVDGCGSKLEDTAQDVNCLLVVPEEAKTWQSTALAVPSGRNRLAVTLAYPDVHGVLLQNDVNLIVRAGNVERHGNMIAGDQGFDKTSKKMICPEQASKG